MSFPRYLGYKTSGTESLGKIPDNWSVKPLKRVATCNDEVLSEGTAEDTLIEYVEISDVNSVSGIIGSTTHSFSSAPSRARRLVRNQDVLISTVRTYLRAIAPVRNPAHNLVVSTGFAVVRPDPQQIIGGYLGYLTRSDEFISEVIARSVGVSYPAINASDIMQLVIPIPTFYEQTQIARFLDHETAKIDALIHEQERLIELLQEKRQAVISHVVTKGLDPDVPMKDSGVEWLGEVPAHWDICPIKFLVSTPVTDGPHETPEFIDEGIPFISAEAVSQGEINFNKAKFISPHDHSRYSRKYKPKLHDIFMVKSGATTGTVAINESDKEFNIWSPLAVIRCSDIADPHFILHAMRSQNFQESIVLSWSFGTQQNIGMGVIENLPIALPPLQEQLRIKNYLNEIGAAWDSLELEARKAINLLKERRSALISAAVTGKIDVRNWQPPVDESAFDEDVRQAGMEVTA